MSQAKTSVVDVAEAVRLSGVSLTMITYLGRIEVFQPSGQTAPGRGKPRLFTFTDVLFLKVIGHLLSKRIEVKRLGAALRKAKQSADWENIRKSPGRFLVTDGTELLIQKDGSLESKTFDGQFVFAFVVDLYEAHRLLDSEWPAAARKAA